MGWQDILKLKKPLKKTDIRAVNYVMRDGNFKTIDRIMDEIYELIQENRELGHKKVSEIKGRPMIRRFNAFKKTIQDYMRISPEFESRDTGNKTHTRRLIMEYRYIGGQ